MVKTRKESHILSTRKVSRPRATLMSCGTLAKRNSNLLCYKTENHIELKIYKRSSVS